MKKASILFIYMFYEVIGWIVIFIYSYSKIERP